jgi:hypothetical protein
MNKPLQSEQDTARWLLGAAGRCEGCPSLVSWLCLLITFAAATFSTGCGNKPNNRIDAGTATNAIYQSRYFGFTMTIPTGWIVQDQASQKQINEEGAALVAGKDKELEAGLKAADLETIHLFTASKYPKGTMHNPAIGAIAERVREPQRIQLGKDYLLELRRTLESGQLQAAFPSEIRTVRLSGVDFDAMDVELKPRGMKKVKERFYATIKRGYALCFILAYMTDEEEAFERKILDTVKFE